MYRFNMLHHRAPGYQSTIQDQSLSEDLGEIYKKEMFSDVTLVVNDKSYQAHKVILAARSRIFASIFESQTDNIVKITDMKTEVMEEVLRYMYTGKLEKLDQLGKDLYLASEKYGLEGLKKLCEKFMLKTISVLNAFDLYKFAKEKEANELKRDVLKFIVYQFPQIMNTEDWKSLNCDEMNLMMTKELCEAFSLRIQQYLGIGPMAGPSVIGPIAGPPVIGPMPGQSVPEVVSSQQQ